MSDLPSPEQVAHDEAQETVSKQELVLFRALEIACRSNHKYHWQERFKEYITEARRQIG